MAIIGLLLISVNSFSTGAIKLDELKIQDDSTETDTEEPTPDDDYNIIIRGGNGVHITVKKTVSSRFYGNMFPILSNFLRHSSNKISTLSTSGTYKVEFDLEGDDKDWAKEGFISELPARIDVTYFHFGTGSVRVTVQVGSQEVQETGSFFYGRVFDL
jgi:hypothetical protein